MNSLFNFHLYLFQQTLTAFPNTMFTIEFIYRLYHFLGIKNYSPMVKFFKFPEPQHFGLTLLVTSTPTLISFVRIHSCTVRPPKCEWPSKNLSPGHCSTPSHHNNFPAWGHMNMVTLQLTYTFPQWLALQFMHSHLVLKYTYSKFNSSYPNYYLTVRYQLGCLLLFR